MVVLPAAGRPVSHTHILMLEQEFVVPRFPIVSNVPTPRAVHGVLDRSCILPHRYRLLAVAITAGFRQSALLAISLLSIATVLAKVISADTSRGAPGSWKHQDAYAPLFDKGRPPCQNPERREFPNVRMCGTLR